MRRAAILLAVGALAGCSAVNPPSDHVAEPVAADDFCATYAAVLCEGVLDCCPAAAGMSLESCTDLVGPICAMSLSTLVGDQRTGYDADEAGYQLNVARNLTATCDPGIVAWQARLDGLVSILRGTVPEAELCTPAFPESFPDGRVDFPRFYSCEGDLACRVTGSVMEWRCLDRGELGAACVGLNDCAVGLLCQPVSDTRYQCGERLPNGASCTSSGQCQSYRCGECVAGACTCQPADTAEQVYCSLFR
ncbi:MAG: hypothetical protein H6719_36410 [Sandaracinaceae bacterium]|nr:hypothetical protein [Sandaracinaceae bacterium]